MSDAFALTLPKLGESIQGATIVQWLKKEGDLVRQDEPLLEVSTDKVNSEIPSPVAGTLQKICVAIDAEVETGALLALIGLGEASKELSPAVLPQREEPISVQREIPICCKKKEVLSAPAFISPAVMRVAQMENLSIEELSHIAGSGQQGRVTKKDVERHVQAPKVEKLSTPLVNEEGEERVKMTKMRKAIAENMVRSFYEAPHASVVSEVDVTGIMNLIQKEKGRFLETHKAKLTITSFLIQALAKALTQFPMLNASLEKEEIVLKRYINIGMAVNVDGGLMVPVIKNCQDRNLASIAKAVYDLSKRAREHKLVPDEVRGGTVTLTNFGISGALMGVPIIRHPEVAIIGAGAVQKRVVVREDDSFAVRQMIYLTLTFDHRIIDGILACEFLAAVKQQLESVPMQV